MNCNSKQNWSVSVERLLFEKMNKNAFYLTSERKNKLSNVSQLHGNFLKTFFTDEKFKQSGSALTTKTSH